MKKIDKTFEVTVRFIGTMLKKKRFLATMMIVIVTIYQFSQYGFFIGKHSMLNRWKFNFDTGYAPFTNTLKKQRVNQMMKTLIASQKHVHLTDEDTLENAIPLEIHTLLPKRDRSVIELEKQKTILLWYTAFNDTSMVPEFSQEALSEVSYGTYRMYSPSCGNCLITHDRSLLSSSDAVVFDAYQTNGRDFPPKTTRDPNQLYVWWTQESSGLHRFPSGHGKLINFFNQSMTVRRSSGIYSPYNSFPRILKMLWSKQQGKDVIKAMASLKHIKLTDEHTLENAIKYLPTGSMSNRPTFFKISSKIPLEIHGLLAKKTRATAWVISNCDALKRFQYFNKLKAVGLKIDLFGKCGQTFPIESRFDPSFYEVLSRYKFYLAFENSYHCEDYFTEKLWYNSLYSGAVPIIFGPHKDDLAAVLPPKSYIHTDDFETPQHLVNYLNYLDQNLTAYSEYLEWRSWIKYLDENGDFYRQNQTSNNPNISNQVLQLLNKFATRIPTGFCSLCRTIHKSNQLSNVIPDVAKWYSQDRPECLEGQPSNLLQLLQLALQNYRSLF